MHGSELPCSSSRVCGIWSDCRREGLYRAFVFRGAYQFVHPGKQVSLMNLDLIGWREGHVSGGQPAIGPRPCNATKGVSRELSGLRVLQTVCSTPSPLNANKYKSIGYKLVYASHRNSNLWARGWKEHETQARRMVCLYAMFRRTDEPHARSSRVGNATPAPG